MLQTRESEERVLRLERPQYCLSFLLTCLQRGNHCDSHDSPPPSAQSTNMAFGKVTEETVYTCTGHPLKSDIANILDWMLNQDFTTAYRSILPHVLLTVLTYLRPELGPGQRLHPDGQTRLAARGSGPLAVKTRCLWGERVLGFNALKFFLKD